VKRTAALGEDSRCYPGPSRLFAAMSTIPDLLPSQIVGVPVIADCGRCDGSGTVADPEGFGYAELNQLEGAAYDRELARRGHGPTDRFPPEEGDCPDCEGTGRRQAIATRDVVCEWVRRG
jgi:hypothetical protein